MREIMARYSATQAGTRSDVDVQGTIASVDIDRMILRYTRRAQFLETGLAAAHGDHESAEAALLVLTDDTVAVEDLADEHTYLVTYAQILCAVALCDDDLHVRSVPLWEKVLDALDRPDIGSEFTDHLLVVGGTGYGRFCIETGRLSEAEPWLRRAGARAEERGWELGHRQNTTGASHGQLGRSVTAPRPNAWSTRRIRRSPRAGAHTTYRGAGCTLASSRCRSESWTTPTSASAMPSGIGGKSRSRCTFIVFCCNAAGLTSSVATSTRRVSGRTRRVSCSTRGRGTVGCSTPASTTTSAASGGRTRWPTRRMPQDKLERAVELKVPAALAVDSVRHSIADADARMRWATYVSARILAGAFAVAWESENTELVSELVEYHSARGTFSAEPDRRGRSVDRRRDGRGTPRSRR